jgi:hypothetical protein
MQKCSQVYIFSVKTLHKRAFGGIFSIRVVLSLFFSGGMFVNRKNFFVLLIAIWFFFGNVFTLNNGGVIPYTYHNNKLIFLFGDDGRGFSDFGGKAEKFDTSDEHAAVREFNEETCFFIAKKLDPKISRTKIYGKHDKNEAEKAHQVIIKNLTKNKWGYVHFHSNRGRYNVYFLKVNLFRDYNVKGHRIN